MHQPSHRARRGLSVLYLTIFMGVIFGVISFAVDLGRVQLVKTELRAIADAGARAALAGLSSDVATAQQNAVEMGSVNRVDGSALVFDADQDIQFGNWDHGKRSFAPVSGAARSTANAVRVTARKTSSRGTAVPTVFARLLGITTIDVEASATATRFSRGFGVIGLDFIKMGGNSSDSYWAPDGYTAGGEYGSIASNGNITLSGSTSIHGDAYAGVGMSVIGGAGRVSGEITALTSPLRFPNGSAGTYATTNDNYRIHKTLTMKGGHANLQLGANKAVTLNEGNYYLRDFTLGAGSTLNLSGPTTIYVYGSISITGNVVTAGNLPKNLKIVTVPAPDGSPPGPIKVWSGGALYAEIYAPQSDITLGGTGDIFGSVLGKSVDMTGTSAIHYDTSTTWTGQIVLVE